jgi:hypothetical protein
MLAKSTEPKKKEIVSSREPYRILVRGIATSRNC